MSAEPGPEAGPVIPEPEAPEPAIDSLVGVQVEGVEREIYYRFGVRVEVAATDRPRAVLEKIRGAVASGLAHHRGRMLELVEDAVVQAIDDDVPADAGLDGWDPTGLAGAIRRLLHVDPALSDLPPGIEPLRANLLALARRCFEKKEHECNADVALRMFLTLWLDEIDRQWVEQLEALAALREGIGLRAYGRLDPKLEYQREAFERFQEMLRNIQRNTVSRFFHVQLRNEADAIRKTLRYDEAAGT